MPENTDPRTGQPIQPPPAWQKPVLTPEEQNKIAEQIMDLAGIVSIRGRGRLSMQAAVEIIRLAGGLVTEE